MKDRVSDLARARVLISNDDGINAPGLKILERAVRPLVREVWVVAPETEQSGAGHSLTLRRPLRLRQVSHRRFAVDGTPTDCVLLGLHKVLKDRPPDLVLSGINRGGNLGEDVTYSGTVAAAMEATLLGFPAIAFSQVSDDRRAVKWATAEHWVGPVLDKLAAHSWPPYVFINVNFPDVPARSVTGIEVTRQVQRRVFDNLTEGVDPRGDPYFWIGSQRSEDSSSRGTDLFTVKRGAISITPLSLDLTHGPTARALRKG
jgi:5'-nucleotidase